jgi:hypothetical protein
LVKAVYLPLALALLSRPNKSSLRTRLILKMGTGITCRLSDG